MTMGTKISALLFMLGFVVRPHFCFVPQQEFARFGQLNPTNRIVARQSKFLSMSTVERDTMDMPEVQKAVPSRDRKTLHRARKKKTKNRKARRSEKAKEKEHGVVSEGELVKHLDAVYHGDGGAVQPVKKRRNLSAQAAMDSNESNPSHAEQVDYLRFLDRHPALVLNADYQPLSHLPLSLWSWQDVVKSVFSGKVTVVDTYPDVLIRAVSINMPLPAVIALNEYIPLADKQKPAFTRRNVFLRDGYRCQYCSNRFRSYDLSLDHVIPRSHGGKLCWENAVTSCKACNGRKGSLLPPQLDAVGMSLLREPRMPSSYELSMEAGKMCTRKVHPAWEPFLPR